MLRLSYSALPSSHAYTKKNAPLQYTYRDPQFQKNQAKLVCCPKGRIFDVVVDLRADSTTFGKWQGFTLGEEEERQLYIPTGFAHGFAVLSEEAHVLYKLSAYYDPKKESGFRYDDPSVKIHWPIVEPTLSLRDKKALSFMEVVHDTL